MNDVDYAYLENNKVITNSNFEAHPGEIIALVGPSGEGKTTMIRLILGLIHPDSGNVKIYTQDHRSVEANAEVRHLFAYVPQGNTILQGTIAENMRMVKQDASDEEIIEALKLACAWDFIKKLPDRKTGLEEYHPTKTKQNMHCHNTSSKCIKYVSTSLSCHENTCH